MSKVIVYTTTWCPWCDRLKEWLKEKNVDFKEVSVEDNQEAAEEMIKKSGQQGVPVTDVDGTIIIGFDVPALKKALKITD